MTTTPGYKPDTRFFGHPWPLVNLFGVEMWERFSFYGMQAILAYYLYYSALEGGLGFDKTTSLGIVGAYGGFVYLSTIAGAWVSDRLLGAERTLFYSACLVMAGHIALAAIPGATGVAIGLVLVAVGSGGVKGNATKVVGDLYPAGDTRRDAGFSLFYMGVNLGAFIGPLLTGYLQDNAGFHWGFGLAAVGMALGLIQYGLTRKMLPRISQEVPNPASRTDIQRVVVGAVIAIAVFVALILLGVITAKNLVDAVIISVAAISLAYFVFLLRSSRVDGAERNGVRAFIPLFLSQVAFWALFQQMFTFVAVYADERLDRSLGGWEFPASWIQSVDPVYILIFAPVFAALWTKLGPRQPSTPIKFAIGTIGIGVAFLAFLLMPAGVNTAPLIGLLGIMLIFALAELCISPVGLSVSTKLAPRAFATQMVALNFLSISLGTALAGRLATFYDQNDEAPYFLILGGTAIGVGLVVVALTPMIKRLAPAVA
ncbi:peptide MFS transporter [Tsukamurella ocularis]|uniref:peptide MFS transporter n=1 Tax=Tsukamurella ocularis TaxID=1970234 RepID=UPI00216A5384|nr:peptide MFS transporter [Tsukamurella ocularis]MCS3782151.1 POT family proton-dependent oligopeptide transporter [Tsukamurella ocularis]MCS3789689.1 POT family proton-dependent oligopeptide transporter [Tsukamurella ocularis]MCS3852836.1 POT family proton-dependent oligopeptide transporter [Tsukamurella ocularis]